MGPGTDKAGSGHSLVTTPSPTKFFHNNMKQMDRLKENINSISSKSNLYPTINFLCV